MKIALGADHRGHSAGREVASQLRAHGHDVQILGDCGGQPCDYPDQAWLVAQAVAQHEAERGILLCGSGIGVSIAANKVPGIRAAIVMDTVTAALSREHNDANVLCLSADETSLDEMSSIIDIWLQTEFGGGRHARRVKKIDAIERGEDPTKISDPAAPSTPAPT